MEKIGDAGGAVLVSLKKLVHQFAAGG